MAPSTEHLKVTLRRSGGDEWIANQASLLKPQTAPNPRGAVSKTLNLPTASVAHNVSSFLSGIRASFRSENVNMMPVPKPKKTSKVIPREKVLKEKQLPTKTETKKMNLKVSTLKLCLGLPNKKDIVTDLLHRNNINVCCLQETEVPKNFPERVLDCGGYTL